MHLFSLCFSAFEKKTARKPVKRFVNSESSLVKNRAHVLGVNGVTTRHCASLELENNLFMAILHPLKARDNVTSLENQCFCLVVHRYPKCVVR